MAVTGAIFNSLVFGGVNSADYGIYITGEAVFNAPSRAVETVSVPGRNGDIIIDQGHWQNIKVTYPAGTFGMSETEFRTALSDFRNAIVSQLGYQRLSDTYHPDEYRMGIYVEGLEVNTKSHNKAGEFDLIFNCKPQRWLTEGETAVTVESGDTLTNPTLYESHPLLMVEGYGGLRFGENRFYLRSATYGDVELIDEQTLDLSRNNSYTFELPSYKYQAGDTITVEPFVAKFRVYDKSGQVRNMTATTTSGPATVTIGGGNTRVLVNVAFDGTIPLTFTAGTTKSYTENITLVYTNSAGSRPRVTANLTILYNSADETITISSEFTTPSSAVIYAEDTEFNGITADSTATVIGEVTYIDCELGEAYKIENGKLLPVSYYLTMTPAKPALIPGDNEITITSDTITGLSIIPRWWQL